MSWHLVNHFSHVENSSSGHTVSLECCCCGSETRGRQWWNRDTGYGICTDCIAYVRKLGESEEQIRQNYGEQGIHWGVDCPSENSYCRDCGAPIPHGERFCADCDMRMELGDSEYQNRIGEDNDRD